MIQIKEQPVKNLISEMTFKEFHECLTILGDQEKEMIERYMEVLKALGVSEELLNQLTIDDLIPFVQNLGTDKFTDKTIPHEIVCGDKTYTIHNNDKYRISIKDLWQIEKHIKKTGKLDLIKTVAIILKDQNTPAEFVYSEAHIFEKMENIANENVAVFLPLIAHVTVELGEKILLLNASTDNL
jgi:hypothetical protein